MKTLRFFGMMLMTMLLAFNFTACGDDDDDKSKDGGGSADYVGIWIAVDQSDRMEVIELKTNSWQNAIYKFSNSSQSYVKRSYSGSLSVSGNAITITGDAPFKTATYSISGNTMTIVPQQQTEDTDKYVMTRATEDQIKKIAAWEALVLASQNAK